MPYLLPDTNRKSDGLMTTPTYAPFKAAESVTYVSGAGAFIGGLTQSDIASVAGIFGVVVGLILQFYKTLRDGKALAKEELRRQREEALLLREDERKQREEERKQREDLRKEAVFQRRLKMTDEEFIADAGASNFDVPMIGR